MHPLYPPTIPIAGKSIPPVQETNSIFWAWWNMWMRLCRLSPTGQASQRVRQNLRTRRVLFGNDLLGRTLLEMLDASGDDQGKRGITWMERSGWAGACGSTVYAWCSVPHVPAFQIIHPSHQLPGSGLNCTDLAPALLMLAWPGCSSSTSQRHLRPSRRLRPSPCWGAAGTRESGAVLPRWLRELARAATVPAHWLRHVNSQKGGGTCSRVSASTASASRAWGGSHTHPLDVHAHIRAHPSASPKAG